MDMISVDTISSPLNHLEVRIKEVFTHYQRRTEGRLKTFMESITEDPEQCKARKAVVAQMLWADSEYLIAHIEELFAGGDHGLIE